MANETTFASHASRPGRNRRLQRGFTLLELMIVVGVIAILTIAALSSYGYATVKARRNQAKGCLTQAAQYMERYYTTKLAYYVAADAPLTPNKICDADTQKFYTVEFSAQPTATAFTVRAVPKASQKDAKCGTLTLDQAGTRAPATDGCW